MNIKEEYGLPNRLSGLSMSEASKALDKMFKERNSAIDKSTKALFMGRLRDVQEMQRSQLELQQNEMQNQMKGDAPTQYLTDALTKGAQEAVAPNWFQRTFTNDNSWWKKNEGANATNVLSGIGLGVAALAPMLANRAAMKSMKPPKEITPMLMDENVTPFFTNRQQLERNIDKQTSTNRQALLRASSGDFGQYAANLQALNAGSANAYANALLQADLSDNEERKRVQQLMMSLKQHNLQERSRVAEMNTQNKAMYDAQMAAFKQATGANIGNIGMSLFNLMQAKDVGKEAMKAEKLWATAKAGTSE